MSFDISICTSHDWVYKRHDHRDHETGKSSLILSFLFRRALVAGGNVSTSHYDIGWYDTFCDDGAKLLALSDVQDYLDARSTTRNVLLSSCTGLDNLSECFYIPSLSEEMVQQYYDLTYAIAMAITAEIEMQKAVDALKKPSKPTRPFVQLKVVPS